MLFEIFKWYFLCVDNTHNTCKNLFVVVNFQPRNYWVDLGDLVGCKPSEFI